jgi:hypothetical protein
VTQTTAAPAVAACPCCGAYSLTPSSQSSTLLAVCDVLVIHALEKIGRRIVRVDRSRYGQMNGRPWHAAHTMWRPDEAMISKALLGAWDVVPAMLDEHGCCNVTAIAITRLLDTYVRDLAITGTGHQLPELRYRFTAHLGISVQEPVTHTAEPPPMPSTPDPRSGEPIRPLIGRAHAAGS